MHPRRLEISTDADDFESNIIFTTPAPGNSLNLPIGLEGNTTYYWRIVTTGECGESISGVFSFTTMVVNSISELAGNSFQLFPNPASENILLAFGRPLEEPIRIEWLQAGGQRIRVESLAAGATEIRQSLAGLPAGLYFLRLSTGGQSVTRKVVVRH